MQDPELFTEFLEAVEKLQEKDPLPGHTVQVLQDYFGLCVPQVCLV